MSFLFGKPLWIFFPEFMVRQNLVPVTLLHCLFNIHFTSSGIDVHQSAYSRAHRIDQRSGNKKKSRSLVERLFLFQQNVIKKIDFIHASAYASCISLMMRLILSFAFCCAVANWSTEGSCVFTLK